MKTIVWDVDDVLNDLMRDWLQQSWRPTHPECERTYEQIVENPPHRILGVTLKEYQESLDHFRAKGFAQMAPVSELLAWFRQYGGTFRHIALTSVPLHGAGVSANWVLQHFGQWIRSFNIVPSPREGDPSFKYDQNKADFLQWWGKADMVVDDNPTTITAVRELGIPAVLAPRPWNSSHQTLSEMLDILTQMN